MIKYFCEFCGNEVDKNSSMPCDDCLALLRATIGLQREVSALKFNKTIFMMPNDFLGEAPEEGIRFWFDKLLPTLKEFAKFFPENETRLATSESEPQDVIGGKSTL